MRGLSIQSPSRHRSMYQHLHCVVGWKFAWCSLEKRADSDNDQMSWFLDKINDSSVCETQAKFVQKQHVSAHGNGPCHINDWSNLPFRLLLHVLSYCGCSEFDCSQPQPHTHHTEVRTWCQAVFDKSVGPNIRRHWSVILSALNMPNMPHLFLALPMNNLSHQMESGMVRNTLINPIRCGGLDP